MLTLPQGPAPVRAMPPSILTPDRAPAAHLALPNEDPGGMAQTVGKLGGALAKAQRQMEAAKRDRGGQIQNRTYQYATLASVWDSIREPLTASELAVVQTTEPHGLDAVCVVTTLVHASGEWIRGRLVMPVALRTPQGFGSAITYARRYGLMAIVGIAPEDDDGASASDPRPEQSSGQKGSRTNAAAAAAPPAPSPAPAPRVAPELLDVEQQIRSTYAPAFPSVGSERELDALIYENPPRAGNELLGALQGVARGDEQTGARRFRPRARRRGEALMLRPDVTLSKGPLLDSPCLAWLTAEWTENSSRYSKRGTAMHRLLAILVNGGVFELPEKYDERAMFDRARSWLASSRFLRGTALGLRAEVVYAYDVAARTARELPFPAGLEGTRWYANAALRAQHGVLPTELCGTLDLVGDGLDADGPFLQVDDYKFHWAPTASPARAQLELQALAVATARGIRRVKVTGVHVWRDREWLEAYELGAWELDTVAVHVDSLANRTAANDPFPAPGAHCDSCYCPARKSCEAYIQLGRRAS